MVTSTCPNPEDLRSFHLGMLDEGRELEVLEHLNSCPTCEDTVANLEGTEDSLVAAVRGSVNSEDNASDSQSEDRPALQQALAEIENLVDPPARDAGPNETSVVSVTERIRDYELLGSLGEGGMGTVYKARHTRLDREVALKLLPARRLRDNAAVARFEREMKAIGRLDHPTIVRATDAGDVDGTHFLAMDYVEGIDLSKLVRLVGPLDVASACEIVRQAAIGLDYAHQQELIHRDVKPSNLMLTLRGEVRILDLGLALFGAASEALDELTTVGQLMGTLDYMAPEQGDNSHDVDARADVYSLGATLFKLLTATAPYDSPGTRTPLAKMKALATVDAPSVAERRSELPDDLVAIVDRALLRDPDDRFSSAKELADSLLPFCEGHALCDLAECGRNLASCEDEKTPQPPTLPPFVRKADIPATPTDVRRMAEFDSRIPGVRRRVATWMLIPLLLLLGIIIWIQTDNGMLVVESAEGNIPIEIRSGGRFHSSETLSVGKNELTIRSGTYEIVLPKEYDSLKVENHVFTLKRGGEWVARISKKDQVDLPEDPARNATDITKHAFIGSLPTLQGANPGQRAEQPGSSPNGAVPSASGFLPSQPGITTLPIPKVTTNSETLVFSGKTFEEWQRSVLTERNPVELRNAVEALCILGRNNRDAEAASTVLQVVDAYPCQLIRGGSEAELVAAAIRYLRMLDPPSVTPAVAAAVRVRGANTRTLILEFLANPNQGPTVGLAFIGQGELLAARLRQSNELRDALIDIFKELEPDNRLRAFDLIVENLDDADLNPTLVTFLDNCSRNENPGRIELVAARCLTDIKPSARLAGVFLTYLENRNEALLQQAVQRSGPGGSEVSNWWSFESDAWLGLAALGKLASGSAGRIAKLIDNVPDGLAKPQTIYLMASPSRVKTRFEVNRQLLPIEILAMIGSRAKSTVPAINNVLKTLTGATPTPQGDYGFDGFHEKLVLERIVGHDARLGVPSPDALTADVEQIRDRPQRLDSALVAISRITGHAARFDVSRIDANGARKVPTGMGAGHPGGAMRSGYPGGISTGMMEGYGGGDEYGESMLKQNEPRLVTYKGKSFAEWTDLRNVSLDIPLSDLRDIFRGASLLAESSEEQKAAAIIASGVFGHVIRQPKELTPELKKLLVTTIEASYSYDPMAVLTPIEDALAQVTPARQAFLLNELLMPVEETEFGFRLQPRAFSRKVVASSQFPNAYNELVEDWDKHPVELQKAILQSEAHLPALGQKNSIKLLTRLVQEAYESAASSTETEAPISDQSMKAAFILAATEPTNAEVRKQLETLLARVLAKPHVLRLSRQPEATANKAKVSAQDNVGPATMRDLDADRLHAAIGLRLACGRALSAETARQFTRLIIQDTERHEIGTFRIISPPDNQASGSFIPNPDGLFEYSDAGMADYSASGGAGYPGMEGGLPGMDSAPGDYPEGALIPYGNQGYSPDHGEFSRRLLMIRLLLSSPPDDAEVRHEIGEQLAESLLKRYPEGFMPAPQSENNNVSIYELVEAGFKSGVRYRKRPDTKKGTLETARFLDTASAVIWNYLPDNRRKQLQQRRVSELQAAQIAAQQPQKIYDGRPFENWLAVVNTERSPDRLVEAVTALAILGKNGRDTEAAYAILKCLAPFSADSRNQKTPEGQLVNTIDHRFWQLDRQTTTQVATELIENGNSSQRKFLLVHNSNHIRNWLETDGLPAKLQLVDALLQATLDDDSEVRWQATAFLIPLLLTNQRQPPPDTLSESKERLTALLSDARAQTPAAICLSQLAPETPGLADILLAEIEQLAASGGNGQFRSSKLRDNHNSLQFPDAYWALRKLIVHNQATYETLTPRLLELLKVRRKGQSGRVFEVDYFQFDHRPLIAELLVASSPQSGARKAGIREALQNLSDSAARLSNSRTSNGEIAKGTQPVLPAYTPVLTDAYPFPLPSSLRYPPASVWEEKDNHQRDDELRASKWALNQLEKTSPVKKTDR